MAKSFATLYRWMVPGWLRWGDGDGVLKSISLMIDENVQRFRDGMTRRFPDYAAAAGDDDALTKIGKDRGIPRGRTEAASHYAARLIAWRYPRGHRVRGSAFALLNQVSEYFGGVTCWTIDANGTRHCRTAAGVESVDYGHPWAWDSKPASDWSRFWVIVDGSTFAAERSAPGDGTIGQTGVAPEDVQAIRRMLTGRAWRPAGTQGVWLVLSLVPVERPDAHSWDGTFDVSFGEGDAAVGAFPAPDATWEHWSRLAATLQVPTRDDRFRYISLSPSYTSQYSGDATKFAPHLALIGGGTYDGNAGSFPATIPLPMSGGTYAGDATAFPAAIPLPDDGSPS